ncbi:MAG: TIGR03663 family protein [Candidatus Schekmanbacteria bacterium]|nr:TIGR03663 family protein [Candidatus Schekmanbacteria bacterium]
MAGLIIVVTAATRFYDLGSRPYHHDESLHAKFSYQLFRGEGYRYDPVYHGPLLYHLTALTFFLFGDSDTTARLYPALTGLLLVCLILYSRREIGDAQSVFCAALVALSPTCMYYSRFARNDIPVALYSLGIVIFGHRYFYKKRANDLRLVAVCMALSFTAKENTYITIFIFATFIGLMLSKQLVFGSVRPMANTRSLIRELWPDFLSAGAIFAVIYILLFSTFLTNPWGVWEGVTGLKYWLGQQKQPRIPGPWWYYVPLLVVYELPAVCLTIIGSIVMRRFDLLRLLMVHWTVLSFAMYSWANEKVPWLGVHIVVPMLLVAGIFIGDCYEFGKRHTRRAAIVCIVASVIFCSHAGVPVNFRSGADPKEMMVFVQTTDEVNRIINEIEDWSFKLSTGLDTKIVVQSIASWPLSWHLRHYTNVSYPATVGYSDAPILVLDYEKRSQLDPAFNDEYVKRRYPLRAWWTPEWSKLTLHGAWRYVVYRETFSPTGSSDIYLAIRKDLFPVATVTSAQRGATAASAGEAAGVDQDGPGEAVKAVGMLRLGWTADGSGFPGGGFSEPHDIAVGPDGTIVVADSGKNRVIVLSADGTWRRAIGEKGSGPLQFSAPQGVAVDSGGTIFVADTWNHRVHAIGASGDTSWIHGPKLRDEGNYFGPRDVLVASNGEILVSDTGNRRIHVLSPHGDLLRSMGGEGKSPGRLIESVGLASDDDGSIYVADTGNQRIQVLDPKGTFLREFPARGWEEYYTEPYLALDEERGILVASDSKNNRLVVYSSAGRYLRDISKFEGGSLLNPTGVAVDNGGGLVVADSRHNRILRFEPGW